MELNFESAIQYYNERLRRAKFYFKNGELVARICARALSAKFKSASVYHKSDIPSQYFSCISALADFYIIFSNNIIYAVQCRFIKQEASFMDEAEQFIYIVEKNKALSGGIFITNQKSPELLPGNFFTVEVKELAELMEAQEQKLQLY